MYTVRAWNNPSHPFTSTERCSFDGPLGGKAKKEANDTWPLLQQISADSNTLVALPLFSIRRKGYQPLELEQRIVAECRIRFLFLDSNIQSQRKGTAFTLRWTYLDALSSGKGGRRILTKSR